MSKSISFFAIIDCKVEPNLKKFFEFVKYKGFTPNLSLARNNLFLFVSQIAIAKSPSKNFTQSSPHSK